MTDYLYYVAVIAFLAFILYLWLKTAQKDVGVKDNYGIAFAAHQRRNKNVR